MDTSLPITVIGALLMAVVTIASTLLGAVWVKLRDTQKRNDELVDKLLAHKTDTKETARILPKLQQFVSQQTKVPSIRPPADESGSIKDEEMKSDHALVFNQKDWAEIERMIRQFNSDESDPK